MYGLSSWGSLALERRLSSCGAWAQLLWGMWLPPGSGISVSCISRQSLYHLSRQGSTLKSYLDSIIQLSLKANQTEGSFLNGTVDY